MSKIADPTKEIEELYRRYLSAWNGRDFQGVADCFSEPAFYALPEIDVTISDRAAFVALLEKVFSGLEADGFSHTEIGGISAQACSEQMAIVDVKSITRLRQDGSSIEVIDAHYVARFSDGRWRFTAAVTCSPGWRGQVN